MRPQQQTLVLHIPGSAAPLRAHFLCGAFTESSRNPRRTAGTQIARPGVYGSSRTRTIDHHPEEAHQMSAYDCGPDCTHPRAHESEIEKEFHEARRRFLKDTLVTGGAVAVGSLGITRAPRAFADNGVPGMRRANHYYVPATDKTVHWGYFSRSLKPLVTVESGDFVTLEVLTHHANDDAERMIQGDPGAESVFRWDARSKAVDRRGAGPMDAKVGAGGGLGVHICTGPIAVRGAEPGDILEVRIVGVVPRPSGNPKYKGKAFGSNAAAWW